MKITIPILVLIALLSSCESRSFLQQRYTHFSSRRVDAKLIVKDRIRNQENCNMEAGAAVCTQDQTEQGIESVSASRTLQSSASVVHKKTKPAFSSFSDRISERNEKTAFRLTAKKQRTDHQPDSWFELGLEAIGWLIGAVAVVFAVLLVIAVVAIIALLIVAIL
jgi:hypothetical protein